MAKGRKRGRAAGRAGGGMLTGMRKGFRGMVHGGGSPKKESAFWNVLFYLLAGMLAVMLAYRWLG